MMNHKIMNEKTIQSKQIFTGNIVSLRVDTVEGPNGITTREIIDHVPAVSILPFKAPDTIFLIKQFRKATEQILIEVPAGCINNNEPPLEAAKRELQEETGFIANTITPICEAYMAPGFCNEYIHFFIATNLAKAKTKFDQDEYIELSQYNLQDALTLIEKKEIVDAKTILSLLYLNQHIKKFNSAQ